MTLPFLNVHTLAMTIAATAVVAPVSVTKPAVIHTRAAVQATSAEHKIYGFVQTLNGNTLVIVNRAGQTVVVDGNIAQSNVRLFRGRPVVVSGTTDTSGVVHARAVWRTFPDSAHWPADR